MILREDAPERYPAGGLDSLVRYALRGRVAGASPSPKIGERIRARVERSKSRRAAGRRFSEGCRMVMMISLSKMDTFLSVWCAAWNKEWVEWRYDPRMTRFLDQYSSMLKLAC